MFPVFTSQTFAAVQSALSGDQAVRLASLPMAAQAAALWQIREGSARTVVWILDGPQTLDAAWLDATSLAPPPLPPPLYYPALEGIPGREALNPDIVGDRQRTLSQCLQAEAPALIVTCVQALMQALPPPANQAEQVRDLAVGETLPPAELLSVLQALGYQFEPEVAEKGRATLRGGLVDVWPPTEAWPVRIEYFGDEVESIRTFDPATQMSREKQAHVRLLPALETAGRGTASLADYLPAATLWAWTDFDLVRHHAETYAETLAEGGASAAAHPFPRLCSALRRPGSARCYFGYSPEADALEVASDVVQAEALPAASLAAGQMDAVEKARRELVARLFAAARKRGGRVSLCFHSEGALDRFREAYLKEAKPPARLVLRVAPLSGGFQSPASGYIVVSENDLYGRRKTLRGRYALHAKKEGPAAEAGPRLIDWTDIQPGDYVVHVDHGIGRYRGMFEILFNGQLQEVLTIEYANEAKLHIPVSQSHLLSRYVGVGKQAPDLHTLGGRQWGREKEAAGKAVEDLAAAMLQTQAARQLLQGFAFGPDTHWQHEFEATFPFEETPDQERAIQEVKADMASTRPMDRLLCGDVGYGKTEVAMRAAFKAVMAGKQVAVLVPTTILAQQHCAAFRERMAAFPVTIEMLSRFRTRGEMDDVVERLKAGAVDIVIGTHRLVQPDVQFKDLGLVIIDEEQRFGVKHKEHLKLLRKLVDVLTMSATPIPRTLYLSLTGARDMSTIQTPPKLRQPIETIVAEPRDDVIRQAILRELSREGQVFYLHNRVQTIHIALRRLRELVPEARIEAAHGQMPPHQLEGLVGAFVNGEFDVLLCTTIIESGVDIPNVNTILIERADRFGVSDLYQLRGRVGRYKHKAYAYLFTPPDGAFYGDARKRIAALQKYSSLGAGFKIALQDLEIRGAGNILGREQSGHIAAVGFDLYCQFLQRTIAQMKGEAVPELVEVELKLDFVQLSPTDADPASSAVIPIDYIEDETQRLGLYRRLAGLQSERDLDALEAELADRFGRLPGMAARLLTLARLKLRAAAAGISRIEVKDGRAMLTRGGDYLMANQRFPRLNSPDTDARLEELLRLIAGLARNR